jgi:hypothetical protein
MLIEASRAKVKRRYRDGGETTQACAAGHLPRTERPRTSAAVPQTLGRALPAAGGSALERPASRMAASRRRTGPRSEWRPASSCRRSTSGRPARSRRRRAWWRRGPPRAWRPGTRRRPPARRRRGPAGGRARRPGRPSWGSRGPGGRRSSPPRPRPRAARRRGRRAGSRSPRSGRRCRSSGMTGTGSGITPCSHPPHSHTGNQGYRAETP